MIFQESNEKSATIYKDNLNYITSSINNNLQDNIIYQDNVMKSDNFNSTFKNFENNINILYTKTRMLEDMILFAKNNLYNNIDKANIEFKSILKSIEDIEQQSINNDFIIYNTGLTPFSENYEDLSFYKDRDGTVLNHTSTREGKITLSTILLNSYDIDNIIFTSSNNYLYNSINNLKNQRLYRSVYVLNSNVEKINEEITIIFDTSFQINTLDITKVNCNIDKIDFMYTDGTETTEDIISYKVKKDVIGIKLYVSCTAVQSCLLTLSDVELTNFVSQIGLLNNSESQTDDEILMIVLEDYLT